MNTKQLTLPDINPAEQPIFAEVKAPPKKPVGFQFHVKNWLGDHCVMSMSYAEKGMHLHLMCIAWQESPPGSLPDDDEKISQWLGIAPLAWNRIHKNKVMAAWKYRTMEDGTNRWIQEGLQRSYEKQLLTLASRQAAARTRWDGVRLAADLASSTYVNSNTMAASSDAITIEKTLQNEDVDQTAQIWEIGLTLLSTQYEKPRARQMIGRWIKTYGETNVAQVLSELSIKAHTVADRHTYITAALSNHQKGNQVRKAAGRGDLAI
jgi:hypothetical protein